MGAAVRTEAIGEKAATEATQSSIAALRNIIVEQQIVVLYASTSYNYKGQ